MFNNRLSRTGNGSAIRIVITSGIVTQHALTKPDRLTLAAFRDGLRIEGAGQWRWLEQEVLVKEDGWVAASSVDR